MLLVLASLALIQARPVTNAPIAPDAIYIGRNTPASSLSVVDLNGFGAGTGSPAYDPACPIGPGQSNFPNDPNIVLQAPFLIPPLAPGATTLTGGSAGVFRLTRDSSLDARMLFGEFGHIEDLAIGRSLDSIFAADPFLCPSGHNLCASTGLKLFEAVLGGPGSLRPALAGETPLVSVTGGENPISWSPHPNPPPLVWPAPCPGSVRAQEPTSVDTPVLNLLAPGSNPLGDPSICLPPTNLLSEEQHVFFQGPSVPQVTITACSRFAFRQQLGHFLYVSDPGAGVVAVVHSNRMTLLDRIPLVSVGRLAMSPNLDLLAITQPGLDQVSFLDVDPASPTFHQVVKTTPVGDQPLGIAWESGNEDVLVCCEGDGTVAVISAHTLDVRKTVSSFLTEPFEVVTTPRQDGFGLARGVYYAWILNRNGQLALFESGPAGVGGIGYDDVIGVAPFLLASPTAIQPDPGALDGAVWITHKDALDPATGLPTGVSRFAATRVTLDADVKAPVTLVSPTPGMRDLRFVIDASLGSDVLTGLAYDLAFDDQTNLGSLPNYETPYSAPGALAMNGKSLVKPIPGTSTVLPVSTPRYLFLAVPASSEGHGVVDVIDLDTLERVDTDVFKPGVQSIQARGAVRLAHYFRQ